MGIDWNAVQAISTSVLVLTSAGAIGYAGLQLRNERQYRAVVNLEKQLSFFLGEGFQAARKRLAQVRIDGDELLHWDCDEPPVAALEVLDFYEHLGLLVKKGHLDVYDTWHTFYEWAQPVYVDLQQLVEAKEGLYVDHYSDFRKLMRQMDDIQLKRMHAKNANHWALFTPDRVIDYYQYELEAGGYTGRPQRRVRPPRKTKPAIPLAAEEEIHNAGGE